MKEDRKKAFLKGLGNWSMAVIGTVMLSTASVPSASATQPTEGLAAPDKQISDVVVRDTPTPGDLGFVTPAWTNHVSWNNVRPWYNSWTNRYR